MKKFINHGKKNRFLWESITKIFLPEDRPQSA
jgi:hypothetical protein